MTSSQGPDAQVAVGKLPGSRAEKAWANQLERGRVPGPRTPHNTVVPPSAGIGTACVHAGTYVDPITRSVSTPIFQTSTYRLSETSYEAFSEGTTRDVPIYTRYGSPSQWAVQEKIATLEGAESAVVCSSGMGAIYATLMALTNRGGHIISAFDVYGGSYAFLNEDIYQRGRSVTFVDPTDLDQITAAIRPETQVLFFETLTNPLIKAIPLPQISTLARRENLLVVVDNTLLTPIACRPLEFGADIVIHSATKYLNGHSDLVAGVAAGSRKYADRIWAQLLKTGCHLEPFSCFLLERGLKTLRVRFEAECRTAEALAQALHAHPEVVAVHHPGTPGYEYPYLAEYSQYGGAMLSFEVAGGDERAVEFLKRLRVASVATSLGGVESLVSTPFNTSHSALTASQRQRMGINPGLIRFSVGLEDPHDLISDIQQSLAATRRMSCETA
jgi:cystathionine beta-lyase/cystathionine gamma-synthase